MIYNKLPIILLTQNATNPSNSTDSLIASYILNNLDSIKELSISELAEQCNVSNSSISRFCRNIGLQDFFELKECIVENKLVFEKISEKDDIKSRMIDQSKIIKDSFDDICDSLKLDLIENLVADIYKYKQVTLLGLLKASTASINLQTDLLMLNKPINVKMNYNEQLHFIENANQNDLIIIFSYTGTYLEQGVRFVKEAKNKPKVYLITGNKNVTENDFIYKVIHFESSQKQIQHPYQLIFISSLIAQEYAHYLDKIKIISK